MRPSKPARRAPARRPARRTASGGARTRPTRSAAAAAVDLSTHDQAVEQFELGFQALQQRQFARAAQLLTSVINDFTDEKELQERARVFLAICERQAAGKDAKPRSFEERLNAAVVTVNAGAFDDALAQLRKLAGEAPENDHVQYMLAVTCASRGDMPQALVHLNQAIELAPENRLRAIQDPDLEPLRHDPGFAAVADALARRRKPVTPTKKR